MTQPEVARRALRHNDGGLVFSEQWHAQVIAVVDLLIAEGRIDPEEWSQTLGAELSRRASQGTEDTDANYYTAFLMALEQTLKRSQFVAHAEVDKRERDWREAYLSTPHGKPVVLRG